MTLTDNIRNIEELTRLTIKYTDAREYESAHCCLDDIEKKVRKLHRHLDHLQRATDASTWPVEEG